MIFTLKCEHMLNSIYVCLIEKYVLLTVIQLLKTPYEVWFFKKKP